MIELGPVWLSLELAATYDRGSPERVDLMETAREHLAAAGSTYDLKRLAQLGS